MSQDKQRQEEPKHSSTISPRGGGNQPQLSKWREDSKFVTEKEAMYFQCPREQNSGPNLHLGIILF